MKSPLKFVVLDVETTGGNATEHRVTEVGAVITDGTQILAEYHSLINPERDIPYYITSLTGIDNNTVRLAPTFAEIAPALLEFLADHTFVAHHVDFDFSFIKNEMQRAGLDYKAPKLCTVRYARSLMPDHKGFSLGKLAAHYGIVNAQPHRALADAQTAAQLLHVLMAGDSANIFGKKIIALKADVKLPLNLPRDQYRNVPHAPGVYYLRGADGKPLYIGKAKDLKSRVTQHFLKIDTARGQAFMRQIFAITYELMGSELLAYIKEDSEIRKYWPPHNRAQKKPNIGWHLVHYADQNNSSRLAILKAVKKPSGLVRTFTSKITAENFLYKTVRHFELLPQLAGLPEVAFTHTLPTPEIHNQNVHAFLAEKDVPTPDVFILEKGRNNTEKGFVWIKNNEIYGIGFAPYNQEGVDLLDLEDYTERIIPSPTIAATIASHIVLPYAEVLLR